MPGSRQEGGVRAGRASPASDVLVARWLLYITPFSASTAIS
jgi:hypothetical protein